MGTSWKAVELGSVSLLITSGSRGWAEFYADEGAAFLRITNLTRNNIRPDLRDIKRVRLPVGNTEGSRTRLQANDILVSITADLGIVALTPDLGDAYVNQHIALIRPSHEVFPAFVAYYLSGPGQTQFARLNDAGAKAGLNLASIRRLSLLLPPFGEQRKIAAILSAVDDAIEATQAVVDQLQVVKKAMMAELLMRGLPGRHTRFKQTEIGEVPEEWDVVPFESVLADGDSLSYGILQPGDDAESGVPMVRTVDLDEHGGRADTTILRVSREIEAPYGRTRLRGDEVLLSVMGTVGRTVVVPKEWQGWNVNRALAVIRVNALTTPEFLSFWLRSPSTQDRFSVEKIGSAQKRVNLGDLRKMLLPIPSRDEQDRMCDALSTVEQRWRSEDHALAALCETKTALMSVLLTGEVRVMPDEVAA